MIASDTLDTFRRCAPLPRFRPLGPLRRGRARPADAALPAPDRGAMQGALLHPRRARSPKAVAARALRADPAGGRVVLSVRLLVPLGRDSLIQAVGVSVRDDNVHSVTPWLAGF